MAYEPRTSAYVRASEEIRTLYKENGNRPVSREQVERRIKATPGLMFAQGVTLESVFQTLVTWRLLKRTRDAQENEVFTPLRWVS